MLRTNSQQLNLHRHIYLSCKAQRNPALQYNIDCEIYQYLPARRLTIKELQWATFTYGIIHVRIWHFLRGEGSKIGQICQWIIVKNCRRREVGVKNRENLPTSLMDGPYSENQIVHMMSWFLIAYFDPKKCALKLKMHFFKTFMLINFLVQTLQCTKLRFFICFAYEKYEKDYTQNSLLPDQPKRPIGIFRAVWSSFRISLLYLKTWISFLVWILAIPHSFSMIISDFNLEKFPLCINYV